MRNYDKTMKALKAIPNRENYLISCGEAQRLINDSGTDPMAIMLHAFHYGLAVGYRAGKRNRSKT